MLEHMPFSVYELKMPGQFIVREVYSRLRVHGDPAFCLQAGSRVLARDCWLMCSSNMQNVISYDIIESSCICVFIYDIYMI